MLECANTTLEGTMAQRRERQKCKMHQQDAAQFSPKHDVLPQEWCAHDVAIKKVGVELVRFSLGLLMSIAPPAIPTLRRHCRQILNFASLFWSEQFGTHTSDLEIIESSFWFMNSSETIYASYSNIANLRATATLRTFTITFVQSDLVLEPPISKTDRV